jgi:hypothetical protein
MTNAPTKEPALTFTAEPAEVLIQEARRRGRRHHLFLVGVFVAATALGVALGLLLAWGGGHPGVVKPPFGAFGAGSPSMSPATKAAFKTCERSFAEPGSNMKVLASYPSTAGLLTSAAHRTSWYDPGRPSHYAGYPSSAPMTVCYLAGRFAPSTPPGVNIDWSRGVYVVPPPGGPATRHGIGAIPLAIGTSRFTFVPPPTRL